MLSISERQFSVHWIASLQPEQRQAVVADLSPEQLKELLAWRRRARDEQLPPPGDWRTWLFLAGRGAGKTRRGAEWIHEQIQAVRKLSTLDEITKEKQRVSETLARVDAQREKLTSQFGELDATERVLARYSKGTRVGKMPLTKTATMAMSPAAPARSGGSLILAAI